MKLNFIKMNPAGNTTVFILDPVPQALHGQIAQALMKPEYLSADQVGFIEKPSSAAAAARLQMMGGEFCGNAARALAALLAGRKHAKAQPSPGGTASSPVQIPLEVSGYEGLLETTVKRTETHYWAAVTMPPPTGIWKIELVINKRKETAVIVELPGITHAVFTGVAPSQALLDAVARRVGPVDALGLMFYEPEKQFMTPLVAVIKAETLVWEGSCASGTVALAASRAEETGRGLKDLPVKQPGGLITVDIDYTGGKPGAARIKGPVEFVAEGTVNLP